MRGMIINANPKQDAFRLLSSQLNNANHPDDSYFVHTFSYPYVNNYKQEIMQTRASTKW